MRGHPLHGPSWMAARFQLFKWSQPISIRMVATARKTRRRAAHFSSKNSIEILSPSPMQFNLIDRTLPCVTFSIKNKWYGPDIWKPGICFCGQFDVPVANLPTCSSGKAKHGEGPLGISSSCFILQGAVSQASLQFPVPPTPPGPP